MADVIVIGAGLGGLAAAVELSAAGRQVLVLESLDRVGGKAGVETHDGVDFDTGPSVLTMPDVLGQLLGRAGMALGTDVVLRQPEPAFRYRWPDGTIVDMHHDVGATLDSVGGALGADARGELERFLGYSKAIWDAAAPRFVYGAAPTIGRVMAMGLGALADLRHIDPLRSMDGGIGRFVRTPKLVDILRRYATYNGSDPRRAPATLNCIAHVELALGGYGIEGGISRIPEALAEAARRLGARFRFDTPVRGLQLADGRVAGVRTDDGVLPADLVITNADAAQLTDELLPAGTRHGIPTGGTPSMSGWNTVYRAKRLPMGAARPAHEVLFPEDYSAEFSDIFDRERPPRDPTVYLCAQASCHGRTGWGDAEPVFAMANAPAEPAEGASDPARWGTLAEVVRLRLVKAGLLTKADRPVWTRTPTDLARRFPGSRGAIYGLASNDMTAAFRRPRNAAPGVPGLFLASGSAHPGGGMPMAMLSGVAAANAAVGPARPAVRDRSAAK
jgi:phytoene desaturase